VACFSRMRWNHEAATSVGKSSFTFSVLKAQAGGHPVVQWSSQACDRLGKRDSKCITAVEITTMRITNPL
jgi:hypothetical protein